MVKARIERDANGVHRIFIQRNKFKHWFELGKHHPTDSAFDKALEEKNVQWPSSVSKHDCLF